MHLRSALAIVGVLPLSAPCALAEQTQIEEVLVTAEKREATLQETPVAVTVLTRDNLELRNIDDLAQVQFAAPALVFGELADMAQITMRGVGVDISQMDAEPGVAVYADGIYRGGLTSSGERYEAISQAKMGRLWREQALPPEYLDFAPEDRHKTYPNDVLWAYGQGLVEAAGGSLNDAGMPIGDPAFESFARHFPRLTAQPMAGGHFFVEADADATSQLIHEFLAKAEA